MTAHTISNRRLLAGCITVLAVLTLFLGVYAKSGRQVLALRGELARVQPGGLDAGTTMKTPGGGDTRTARHGVGL
ncbi:hypothetical protein AYO42_01465 [Rhizomicrobium sp. SCGC AG-212-E05]|nr:hypothetical protein AYO42_01465 [Rhizomicrobium sp. SCGC AG-212-E05]